ncbi:Notchless protein [Ceratobasidium sp. AG-Ba]|nr:Notchless protein [Ceratobasidium sp. AG-Ba]
MSSEPSKRARVREFLKKSSRLVGQIAGSPTSSTTVPALAGSQSGNFRSNTVYIPGLGDGDPSKPSKIQGTDAMNSKAISALQNDMGDHKRSLISLKSSFEAFGETAAVIPPLKSLIDILSNSINVLLNSNHINQEYEGLANNVSNILRDLEDELCRTNPSDMDESIKEILKDVKQQSNRIDSKLRRTGARRYIDAEQDADEIIQIYRNLEASLKRLNINAILDTWRITYELRETTNKKQLDAQLERMDPVKEARYDSSTAEIRRGGCTPNTRVLVLEELVKWSQQIQGSRVYWMNGMAGTGKTTIAYSFCEILKDRAQLGGSFFCSRLLPGSRDANRIIPTLAYQLALIYSPFRNELINTLNNDRDIISTGIENQFETLLNRILRYLDKATRPHQFVIIIDALDECSDRIGVRVLVNLLLRFASELPVKFFVTSRPEPGLLDPLFKGESIRSIFHLHDIEESLVQADIELYLAAELSSASISEDQITLLAKCSGKLFIYAATAARYILPGSVLVNPQKRLNIVLTMTSTQSNRLHESLDALYATILSASLDNPVLELEEINNIRMILDTVLCAQEPLSVEALARLMGLESEEAYISVQSLGSVLHVSKHTGLVSTLHASFPEFMLSQERSGRYYCRSDVHHRLLATRCLATLNSTLQFNICRLDSSFFLDKDILWLPNEIEKQIPLHLVYACKYWSAHLTQSRYQDELAGVLEDFLCGYLMFWFEVLNLKRSIGIASVMLSKAHLWMQSANIRSLSTEICRDAQKFATVISANSARDSTPHIYTSVLTLWDRNTPMWRQYGDRVHGLIRAEGVAIETRQLTELASWRVNSPPQSIAVSPDGMSVAAGCANGHVLVWDTHTSILLLELFGGRHDPITTLTFSLDGTRLIALDASVHIAQIQIWNTQTGQLLTESIEIPHSFNSQIESSPGGNYLTSWGSVDDNIRMWDARTRSTKEVNLAQYQDLVECITYSADGKQIAIGTKDWTVHILDAYTCSLVTESLRGHQARIRSITFSPNGKRIASGSEDSNFFLWDPYGGSQQTDTLILMFVELIQLKFSPDSAYIATVSGLDFSVSVWDAHNGALVNQMTGHTSQIHSLAYSPDGSRIYSASEDSTIRVWDPHSRYSVQIPYSPYNPIFRSLCLSDDGTILVTGCQDGSIYAWNPHTGAMLPGTFRGHGAPVESVAFSPDGERILSHSVNGIYFVWDLKERSAILGPLEVPEKDPHLVKFSPDFGNIATISQDSTVVQIWDLRNRSIVAEFSQPNVASALGYSWDSARIVTGSTAGDIFIWNAQDGKPIARSLKPHRSGVSSLRYSPNGEHIVSGFHDGSISIWDASTGDQIAVPFVGHSDQVDIVSYSWDGRYILSGSLDSTIRIWDASSGNALITPLKLDTSHHSTAISRSAGLWASIISNSGAVRVWQFPTDYPPLSDRYHTWNLNEDGWVVAPDGSLLLWVPPDLRHTLLLPQNTILIHNHGSWEVDFTNAYIGPQWQNFYKK